MTAILSKLPRSAYIKLMRMIGGFALVLGTLIALLVAYQVETRYFPVFNDFRISTFYRDGQNIVVAGTVNRLRPCRVVSTYVWGIPKEATDPNLTVLQMNVSQGSIGGDNATGYFAWGPIVFPSQKVFKLQADKYDAIELRVVHHCHALWNQESTYIKIPLSKIPD